MLSTVSNGTVQSDAERDAQKPESLTENDKNIQSKKLSGRKTVVISLAVTTTVFCICATIIAVTYGYVFRQSNTVSINDKDARIWQNSNQIKATRGSCGLQKINPTIFISRIVNGLQAIPHSWPWVVTIGLYGPKSNLPHACGGALINKQYLITAAHCVNTAPIFEIIGNPIPSHPNYANFERMMRVYVGVHNRDTDINALNTYYVTRIIRHPKFNQATFENDIAIIKLDREVEISKNVDFLCFDKQVPVEYGESLYAIGWGFTENTINKASNVLMQVSLSVKTKSECELSYFPDVQFCAGTSGLNRRDTCNGDSGGPMMKYHNNRWTLVGIVSNGDVSCEGVGIYTIVSRFYDWILFNTS